MHEYLSILQLNSLFIDDYAELQSYFRDIFFLFSWSFST